MKLVKSITQLVIYIPAFLTRKFLLAVDKGVFVETCGVKEDLFALVAHEVVLLAVDLHVDIEGVGVGEDLVAEVTGLEALACVYPHVILELLLLAEHHMADGTRLPLLPGVGPLMGVTCTLSEKTDYHHLTLIKICSRHFTLSLNVISQKLHL